MIAIHQNQWDGADHVNVPTIEKEKIGSIENDFFLEGCGSGMKSNKGCVNKRLPGSQFICLDVLFQASALEMHKYHKYHNTTAIPVI